MIQVIGAIRIYLMKKIGIIAIVNRTSLVIAE